MGIGCLVCIINLLIAPVLMRLSCGGKGTKDFSKHCLFSNVEIIVKTILVPGNSLLF